VRDVRVGPGRCYLPRHRAHFEQSFLESKGTLRRGGQYLAGLTSGRGWVTAIANRTRSNHPTGCPGCNKCNIPVDGRAPTDTHNLQVHGEENWRLDLLQELAHPDKAPRDLLPASNEKVPRQSGKFEDWCRETGREELLGEWDDPDRGPGQVSRGSKVGRCRLTLFNPS